ncbi:hypothetical protein D3C78_1618890 [compost metagenome]
MGATRPGQVITAIILTRSFLSVLRSTARRPTGTISAPPMPWSTRAATNISRLWLSPHSKEARVKTTIAPANTRHVPNRSAIQLERGMKTATARM